jgi:hypothetical protein
MIYAGGNVVIEPIHPRSKKLERTRSTIKRLDSNKNLTIESDKDLQLMLKKGKKLISYNEYTN